MFGRARSKKGSRAGNTPPLPLVELVQCVDRLNELIQQVVQVQKAKEASASLSSLARGKSGGGSGGYGYGYGSSGGGGGSGSGDIQSVHQGGFQRKTSYANILKKGSTDANDDVGDKLERKSEPETIARFLPMDPAEEEEIIELMRRIAELVVQGEQRAAMQLMQKGLLLSSSDGSESISNASSSSSNANAAAGNGDGDLNMTGNENAIFEYFCEANVMSTMINISTGAAFSSWANKNDEKSMKKGEGAGAGAGSNTQNHDKDEKVQEEEGEISKNLQAANLKGDPTSPLPSPSSKKKSSSPQRQPPPPPKRLFLPAISIAIQAIQSISILIQNVSRATSLYFLLSNNKVTELINLPLELYSDAEHHKRDQLLGMGNTNNNYNLNTSATAGTPTRSRRRRRRRDNESAEISELTTGFVAFLKSLAMRMNPETLQFYLTYPASAGASLSASTSTSMEYNAIQFPLYARALQFCDPEEDSFVRTTAMNICLNTLRLATKEDDEEEAEETPISSATSNEMADTDVNGDIGGNGNGHGNGGASSISSLGVNSDRPDMKVCPDGTSLHLSGALPFRERLAIAQYVCDPSRVQNLTAGIFTKLAKLCGSVEEAIRTMDTIDGALTACFVEAKRSQNQKGSGGGSSKKGADKSAGGGGGGRVDEMLLDIDKKSRVEDEKAEIESLQMERIRHVKMFQDAVADFQDEFYLLEDVLKVGLVPLNEQIVEMMFAAVIYPTVLTPLQLFPKKDKEETEEDSKFVEPNPFGSKSMERYMVKPSHARGQSNASSTKSSSFEAGTMELLYDSSLAKTALFVVACIYHYISHKQLLHLLTTALLHPFAPKVSCDLTLEVPLEIVHKDKDGKLHIKTEDSKKDSSKCHLFGNSYDGIRGDNDKISHSDNNAQCTFVLAPALSNIFHSSTTGIMPKALQQKVRPNPFRRTILSCLSGTDGMEELQFLAVYAMDAIISTSTASVLKGIILSGNSLDETDDTDPKKTQRDDASAASDAMSAFSTSASNYMIEFIASMCASLMTATISFDGLYCLKYNDVAAHAIYCAAMIDSAIKKAASKLLDHKRRQSGSFMSQMPSRLSKQKNKEVKKEDRNSLDYDLKMDCIFFDDFCEGGKSVVENTQRKQNKSSGSLWDGPGYIPVAKDGCINDLSKYVQEDLSINHEIGHDEEESAYRCGANSAVAHLQLDSFARLLKENIDSSMLTKQKGYIGVSALALTTNRSVESSKYGEYKLLSPLSHVFGELLFGEDVSSTANPSPETPQPGSIITLVGRGTFPCVCEVTEHTESLFTDGNSLVVAEGLKWQSLYLVLLGKHMILTETVKGDSGSNGRVITSCPLSCLIVQNDAAVDDQNVSAARRLFIVNFSPELHPPRLFEVDHSDMDLNSPSSSGGSSSDEVRITRSELGLWFEDSNAAAKAYKALWTRINKARSKRGQKIREALAHDDRLRFPSLFKS